MQIKVGFFMFITILFFAGCVGDEIAIHPDNLSESGNIITITVNIPGQQAPSTRSIANDKGEATVKTIDILVFEESGVESTQILSELATGEIISQSGNKVEEYKVKFKTLLEANEKAKTVAIIANVDPDYVKSIATAGKTKKEILASLTLTSQGDWKTDPGNYTPIPMYGESELDEKGVTSGMKIENVPLTRMLARIDVVNNAHGFNLSKIYLCNFNQSGNIAPAWDTNDGSLLNPQYENPPMIPVTNVAMNGIKNALSYNYQNKILLGEIYTFEALKTSGEEGRDSHTNAICLVIKGTWIGDNKEHFYRIDFTAGSDKNGNIPGSHNFNPSEVDYMHVYRNHLYSFEITEVNGPGYASMDEAYKSLGIMNNLKTSLLVVDISNIKDIVFNGRHYLGIDEEITFSFLKGEGKNVQCVTNYAYGWQIDSSKGSNGIEYVLGDENWLKAHKDGGESDLKSAIKIESLSDNISIANRVAYVNIKAGTLTHQLKVMQNGLSPMLEVTGPEDFNYLGGTNSFTVNSVAKSTLSNGEKVTLPVPWITEFSEDNGLTWTTGRPGWLTEFPANGDGNTVDYSATAASFEIYSSVDLNTALKDAPNRGDAGAHYDLSTKGGITPMNTANCYIINGPGHYKLPLVYGNAIKDGKVNESAYKSSIQVGSYFLKTFVRNDNKDITSPYIYDQTDKSKVVPQKAIVVWMDAPDLVSNTTLTDGNEYLGFEIPKSSIAQGNAIVAVQNADGGILWSWHIWVTPLVDMENPVTDKVVSSNKNETYYLMQYNLGWCGIGSATTYGEKPRNVQVRITQTGVPEPLSEIFIVTQKNGFVSSTIGDNPYWQWGRKDPILGGKGGTTSNFDKPFSSPSGKFFKTQNNYCENIAVTIVNPQIYYYKKIVNDSNWLLGCYDNLWNINKMPEGDNDRDYYDVGPVIKTVYDPSPVGFTIPPSDALSNFYNSKNSLWKNYGRIFPITIDGINDEIFFPALGSRNSDNGGSITGMTEAGNCWTATPSTRRLSPQSVNRGAIFLSFTKGSTDQEKEEGPRLYAFSVRCAKETK